MINLLLIVGAVFASYILAYFTVLLIVTIVEWKSIIFTIQCLALISMAEVVSKNHASINLSFEEYSISYFINYRQILIRNGDTVVVLYDSSQKYFYTNPSSMLLYSRFFKAIVKRIK